MSLNNWTGNGLHWGNEGTGSISIASRTMNTSVVWNDQVPERDGVRNPINDTAISPGRFLKYICAI